jgi:hypothetical protein
MVALLRHKKLPLTSQSPIAMNKPPVLLTATSPRPFVNVVSF